MGIGEVGELLRRLTVHIRGSNGPRQSAGSGVVWGSDGTVITNAHVLTGGSYEVELWDGRTLPAEVAERDASRDLAKLKLPASGLASIGVRDTVLQPGETVVAVGNPLGFTGALTTGVVRAVGPMSGLGRRPWVQAAIRLAPGNSGGPLADAAGRLVGINTMIVGGGIALAIPASIARDFMRNGAGPRLGVAIQAVDLGRKRTGLLVMHVEAGSAAEYASLLIGDVLLEADGRTFENPSDLTDAVADAGRGLLRLRFLRGDRTRVREVAVSLAARSSREAA
jgi:serine protease Do